MPNTIGSRFVDVVLVPFPFTDFSRAGAANLGATPYNT